MLAKLYYHNIHGLNHTKLSYIDNHLLNSNSIYVIAEHWFSDFNSLSTNSFFITSSSFPANPKLTGHQNGGLALLASQSLRQNIKIIKITEFTISFHIKDTLYSCVYLPPSMDDHSISATLNNLPPSDMIIGDINVRFGAETRDDRMWNQSRGILISTLAARRGLSLTLPVSGCPRNDHVFYRQQIAWDYNWLPRDSFESDHGRIEMEIKMDPRITECKSDGKRYAFSLLAEPIIHDSVIDLWDSQSHRLTELFSALEVFILMNQIKDRATLQDLIDNVYNLFTAELYHICDSLFPQYDPNLVKSQVDYSSVLNDNPTTAQAVRAFKRSQRSFASALFLQNRDSSKTPSVEAWEHYQGIFNSSDRVATPIIETLEINEDERMSEDRIRNALKKYSSAKAGGPDGLDTRFLKCLNNAASFATVLTQVFNLFLKTSVTPSSWNASRIHLLLKDEANPYADKTRPISLTNVLRRIFEKQLLSDWLLQDWSKLHDHQAGFRRGWSTISNILLSDDLSRSGWPISVFLDLKSAFDKVPHSRLLEELQKRGCSNRVLNLVYSLMVNRCESILNVNGETCEKRINRHCGVFQGSILSPFLFNVFIDSLASSLNTTVDSRFLALLFADDVVIKARTRAAAQKAIEICLKWAKLNGMTWNISKCGVMGTSKGERGIQKQDLMMGLIQIPEVTMYKYLGLPHAESGILWSVYGATLIAKHEGILKATIVRRKAWSMQTRLTIYKVFIRSTLEYCIAPLWTWLCKQKPSKSAHLKSMLLDTYGKALEWIFDTRQSRQILENISGLGDFESRVAMLQGSIARHLRELDPSNPLSSHLRENPISASPNFILQSCKISSLLDEWKAQPKDPSAWVGWQTWCRRAWIKKQFDSGNTLPHYVLMRCRAHSFMDRFMGQSLYVARQALAWRSNRLFSRARCPVCHDSFNRAHLQRCKLYERLETHAKFLDSESFKSDVDKISKHFIDRSTTFHYTLLDFYLNNQDYQSFADIVETLKDLLHGNVM